MKLSYAHGTSDVPLIGQTIGDLLDQTATKFPVNDALVSLFENRRFSYLELVKEVNLIARALIALGVKKGDRVGIWSTNCIAWVFAQFATAKVGAILVTINPAYRAYELEFALREMDMGLYLAQSIKLGAP